jgi:hypothetical protein
MTLIYKNLTTKEELRQSPSKKVFASYTKKGFFDYFKDVIFPKINNMSILDKIRIKIEEADKVKYYLQIECYDADYQE